MKRKELSLKQQPRSVPLRKDKRRKRVTMKKTIVILCLVLFLFSQGTCVSEGTGTQSIREMVMTDQKKFVFRNGIAWGMNPQQVSLTEDIPMELRNSSDWSVMISGSSVAVSRFTADLVYMFYQDALRMITYEFQEDCSTLNFQYLMGALSSLYGEGKEVASSAIKGWMDRIYQNYYNEDQIQKATGWLTEDGTSVYLYYYTADKYAILYVCPSENGSDIHYETNGL